YRFRLDQLAASSGAQSGAFNATLGGQMTLSATRPFALDADFTSSGEAEVQKRKVGVTGNIHLNGSLAEILAEVDFSAGEASAAGNAVLRPFTEVPLASANIVLRALDLATFGLPTTALSGNLFAGEHRGEVVLGNAAAGTYDQGRLPVSDLRVVFQQGGGQFKFDHIVAALGSPQQPGGAIEGSGHLTGGKLALALNVKALDLARLDRRLRTTRLGGRLELGQDEGRHQLTLELAEPAKAMSLSAQVAVASDVVLIECANLRLGNGEIAASGRAELAGAQAFKAEGKLNHFRWRDLGRFEQLPDLLLNGAFSLHGTRAPRLAGDLEFNLNGSQLAGQPLAGEGKLLLRADSLRIPKLVLTAGANRLSAEGELAGGEGQLRFALAAQQLAQLGQGFGGSLQADGTMRGSLERPRLVAAWKGSKVRLPGALQIEQTQGSADVALRRDFPFGIGAAAIDGGLEGFRMGTRQVGALSAHVQFTPQANAPLAVRLEGKKMVMPGLQADSLLATAAGTTGQHRIDVALAEPGQQWKLQASGGLKELTKAPRWQGNIERFDGNGRFVAHLAGPAAFDVSQQRAALEHFRLDADRAYIAVEQFSRDHRGLVTKGRFERLQVGALMQFATPEPAFKTDLELAGEWNVSMAGAVDGTLAIRRERGDVRMLGSAPVALGLSRLEATASASRGRLNLQFDAEGAQLGRIDLKANTALAASGFALAPKAAVSGQAHVDIPSLAWLGPLLSTAAITGGRLQSDVSLAGTVDQPRLSGQVAGSGLRLSMTELGVDLRDGTLDGAFQGEELQIRKLVFEKNGGRLSVSGPINLAGGTPTAELHLLAERYALLDRADRRLVISGDSRIALQGARATLSGGFAVDSGSIDIGRADMPHLSDDVVIVGRMAKKSGVPKTPGLDLTVALGKGIAIKGRGLDALMVGQLHFKNEAGEPLRAEGVLTVAKGSYSAYGKELKIERGALRFAGPVTNPSLDILAMRRGQAVEAGVAVRGNVLAPRVTLVSEPTVPDAEKLSWLVLGHGLDSATGGGDIGALQSAAGSLLSQGAAAGVQSQLAAAFGLDKLEIGNSETGLQQRIVTLGKQISSRLYVGFERGLETASNVLHLRYTLSSKFSVEAEAGTRSALSLFYNLSFD
ncbi:MAG: translocation/assembly module TamB domain-containing protein, partial [Betaproteobacteria bacterium]